MEADLQMGEFKGGGTNACKYPLGYGGRVTGIKGLWSMANMFPRYVEAIWASRLQQVDNQNGRIVRELRN